MWNNDWYTKGKEGQIQRIDKTGTKFEYIWPSKRARLRYELKRFRKSFQTYLNGLF